MPRHYLLFASLSYAYSILRPLQEEIRRRGDIAAWYLEPTCPNLLQPDEICLHTFKEVKDFDAVATFAPGNWIYDFFPGIKVEVFHGYPINKRNDRNDDHFSLRGWFDIYCTKGQSSTVRFKELEQKYKYFKVYETGWCKADTLIPSLTTPSTRQRPVILYASTFTKGISSAGVLSDTIRQLATTYPWDWIITLHPKIKDPDILAAYQRMAEQLPNVIFCRDNTGAQLYNQTDVLLCDTSSIIIEYMLTGKPVVTYRNTVPGKHLLNVNEKSEIAPAIKQALSRPAGLMENIAAFCQWHEPHQDGKNCQRILEAVDDYIAHWQGRLPDKPVNLFRKLKLRWKLRYFHWK